MNDLEKNLLIIYTAIGIILSIIYVTMMFWENIKKIKLKDWWRILILVILILPISCVGIFFIFVTIRGITGMFVKNDFYVLQILTNVFNYIIVYRIIVEIREKLKKKNS